MKPLSKQTVTFPIRERVHAFGFTHVDCQLSFTHLLLKIQQCHGACKLNTSTPHCAMLRCGRASTVACPYALGINITAGAAMFSAFLCILFLFLLLSLSTLCESFCVCASADKNWVIEYCWSSCYSNIKYAKSVWAKRSTKQHRVIRSVSRDKSTQPH